jgi:hypothetical protein
MKTKNEVTYTDEPKDAGWDYAGSRQLSRKEMESIGLPLPGKTAKETRINVRLSSATLAGLKARAEEAGMPYQTLAASVLHLVATGRLRLDLIPSKRLK